MAQVILVILIVLLLATLIIPSVVVIVSDVKVKETHKKRLKIKDHIVSEYNAPYEYDKGSEIALCTDGGGLFDDTRIYGLWKKGGLLCFLNTVEVESENNRYYEIPISKIKYFRCYGDEHYYAEVSGGGGGGSSLGGAVVGGILGGATGAVIGSRKGQNPIESTVHHINKKATYLLFEYNNVETAISFYGDSLYKKMFKLIPDKDYENIAGRINVEPKPMGNSDDTEKLKQLKAMLDNELITQSEYEEKKKEVLSKF